MQNSPRCIQGIVTNPRILPLFGKEAHAIRKLNKFCNWPNSPPWMFATLARHLATLTHFRRRQILRQRPSCSPLSSQTPASCATRASSSATRVSSAARVAARAAPTEPLLIVSSSAMRTLVLRIASTYSIACAMVVGAFALMSSLPTLGNRGGGGFACTWSRVPCPRSSG